jgi:dihydrofolate synthase/folylpolyglutamate synthase
MDYKESVRYLYALGNEVLTLKFGLENIAALANALGNPHTAFESVHIAGTNGKGSTAAMLDRMLGEAGINRGFYTSPHLSRITERIKINGAEISEGEFAELATLVRDESENLVRQRVLPALPTFFEQVTAIAFCHFARRGVRIAVLEVGMGGRLDSTNLVKPLISVVTPVSYDHEKYLGNTLKEIAAEKAGIIKQGSKAVIAPQPVEAMEVIMRRCLEERVLPIFVDKPHQIEPTQGKRISVTIDSQENYNKVTLGLRGRHQAINAAAAVATAEELRHHGYDLSRSAIVTGLEQVNWPGRLELMPGAPSILLDGAHNPAGAQVLREFLMEFCNSPITLIFGAMADKDFSQMSALLFPLARNVILTKMDNERAANTADLAAGAYGGRNNIIFTQSVEESIHWAQSLSPRDGVICVTGSLHLVGEIRTYLASEKRSKV